jgi:hypothetical protein
MAHLSRAGYLRLHCDAMSRHTATVPLPLSQVSCLRLHCDCVPLYPGKRFATVAGRVPATPLRRRGGLEEGGRGHSVAGWLPAAPSAGNPHTRHGCRGLRACDSIATPPGRWWPHTCRGLSARDPIATSAAARACPTSPSELSRAVRPRPHCDEGRTYHRSRASSVAGCVPATPLRRPGGLGLLRQQVCRGLRACDPIAKIEERHSVG